MRTTTHLSLILTLASASALLAQIHVWEDKANGQEVADCDPANNPGGERFWPDNNRWNQDELIGNHYCAPFDPGFVREPSNWDTPGYPNSITAQVIINAAPACELRTTVAIGTLSIGPAAVLDIGSFGILEVNGGSIDNNGLLDLNDQATGSAVLKLMAPTSLTGSGKIRFVSNDDNIVQSNTEADILTIGATQELEALPAALANVSGSRLAAAVTNNGTITVNAGGLRIDGFDKTNNGVIRALNGGLAAFESTSVDNTSGTITAGASSTVRFNATTVTGGTLNGPGTFDISSSNAAFRDGLAIAPESLVRLEGPDILTLANSVTNNGLILLNDLSSSSAILRIDGNVMLNGTGVVEFRSNDDNLIDSVTDTDVLTIGPDQTLLATADAGASSSQSRIIAEIANNGTVTADTGGVRLDTNPKTNNNLMQAINGGTLLFLGTTLVNDEGGGDPAVGKITADTGSIVTFATTTVQGGLLDGDGLFDVSGVAVILEGGPTIAAESKFVMGTADTLTIRGTITNHGLIDLDDVGSSNATLRLDGNATLAGTGQVRFNSNDDNVILGVDPADTLTIGPSQELITSAAALANNSGSRLIAPIVNNGTITADTGGVQLDTNPKTNNNLIRAINGGTLVFSGTTLVNDEGGGDPAVGTLTSGPGSTVILTSSTIQGGLLNGSGLYDVSGAAVVLEDGPTIAAESKFVMGTADTLTIRGTITNHGLIDLDDVGSSSATLRLEGDATLAGTGQVRFNSNDDNVILGADPADTLTIGPDQELITSAAALANSSGSRLIAAVINNGTITADQGGLRIDSHPKTNNNLIQAINGGTLSFASVTVDNSNGAITAGPGSTVELAGATIMGGLINGDGPVNVASGNAILDGVGLTIAPETTINIPTSRVLTLLGTVTNNGTIRIADTSAGAAIVRIGNAVTLNGNGKVVFATNDDCILDSSLAADVLTVGANQTLTTDPSTLVGQSFLSATTINNGVIEAREGGLTLTGNQKTNNGIFRAADGGELEVRSTGSTLTNYVGGILTGGRYEIIANGSPTTMDFQSATIHTLGPNTDVILDGIMASFPALQTLEKLDGTLRIHNGAIFTTVGDIELDGVIEFGLGDGATTGFDTTGMSVMGDVDFTNCIIDVADLGLTPGGYEVVNWIGTGTAIGTPTLRNVPPGTSYNLNLAAGSLTLIITLEGPVSPPKVLAIDYDPATNTSTITYQSVDSEVFGVRGGTDLQSFTALPDTAVGDGSVMQYLHNPPASPAAYFYRLTRN